MPENDAQKKEVTEPDEELDDLTPEKDAVGGIRRRAMDASLSPDAQKKEIGEI